MQRPPPCIAAFAKGLRLGCEQHPIEGHFALNDVLMQVQCRKVVGVIVKTKIRRTANQRAPLTDPLPEHVTRMSFESPDGCIASIVCEELGQHLLARAHPKELGVRA